MLDRADELIELALDLAEARTQRADVALAARDLLADDPARLLERVVPRFGHQQDRFDLFQEPAVDDALRLEKPVLGNRRPAVVVVPAAIERRDQFWAGMRERAVQKVREYGPDHASRWAAIRSIAAKIGCSTEVVWKWLRQDDRLVAYGATQVEAYSLLGGLSALDILEPL